MTHQVGAPVGLAILPLHLLTCKPCRLQNDTLLKLVDAEAAERQRLQQLSAALEAQVGWGRLGGGGWCIGGDDWG